jgi:hypothetical protein
MVPALAAAVQPWPNQALHCLVELARSMQKSQEKSINNYNPNFSGLKKTEKQMYSPNPSFGYEKDEDWHQ